MSELVPNNGSDTAGTTYIQAMADIARLRPDLTPDNCERLLSYMDFPDGAVAGEAAAALLDGGEDQWRAAVEVFWRGTGEVEGEAIRDSFLQRHYDRGDVEAKLSYLMATGSDDARQGAQQLLVSLGLVEWAPLPGINYKEYE